MAQLMLYESKTLLLPVIAHSFDERVMSEGNVIVITVPYAGRLWLGVNIIV